MSSNPQPNLLAKVRAGIQNGFLADYYSDLKSLAILVDSVNNNQAYFYTVVRNSILQQKRGDLCVSIYHLNDEPPAMWPQTALRSTSDFFRFRGVAVATSLSTLEVMQKNTFCDRYFYLFDITELFHCPQQILHSMLKDVKVITRNKDYRDLAVNHFKIKSVHEKYMPDMSLDKVIEISKL